MWGLAAFGPPVAFPDQRRAIASVPTTDFEAALESLRREPGVSAVVETAPAGWKRDHPAFHPPPPAPVGALARRIKAAFDPDGVLAPGPDALLRGRRCALPAVAKAILPAAQSAAGDGCGEGFPLPARNDGGNRSAIPAITPWEERPARREPIRFGWGVVVETVRGALSTGC